jgi:IS1 family transposase
MVSMNRMDTARRAAVIRCLIEGNSINSTVRMTGAAKNTVLKLLVEIGASCSAYMDKSMRNLTCERVQADEAWSFCYAKAKNVTEEIARENEGAGDVWTWVAMDADTKLIPTWIVGNRDSHTARAFVKDLKSRLTNRIQLTTDGLKYYFHAVAEYFDDEVDYAALHKIYGKTFDENKPASVRYSPALCLGCEKKPLIGRPNPEHISTSFIERQNLTMRMSMRRFTRLTNGFSKKLENHVASVALYMMYYNYGRKHTTLGTTPAVAAGITDHIWSVEEIVGVLEANEPKATRPARAASSN